MFAGHKIIYVVWTQIYIYEMWNCFLFNITFLKWVISTYMIQKCNRINSNLDE